MLTVPVDTILEWIPLFALFVAIWGVNAATARGLKTEIRAIREDLRTLETSTRTDIQAIRTDMKAMETGIRADITTLDTRLTAEIRGASVSTPRVRLTLRHAGQRPSASDSTPPTSESTIL